MVIVTIAIPDDIASIVGETEDRVAARIREELAMACYQSGAISMGRATELAGMRRAEFEGLLAQRWVERSFSVEDWAIEARI
jgi:predicted HTH domain antitoxin